MRCERTLSHQWNHNQGGDLPLTKPCPTKEYLPRDMNILRDLLVCSHSCNEQPRTALGFDHLHSIDLCYYLTKYFPAYIHHTSVISKFYLNNKRYPTKIRLSPWFKIFDSYLIFLNHIRYSNSSEKIFKKI